MNESVQAHIANCDANNLCRACSQKFVAGEKIIRKVHERCRQAQHRLILANIETDESLVKKGELAEKKGGGRTPSNPVTRRARGLPVAS